MIEVVEVLDLTGLYRCYSRYVAAVTYRLLGRDSEVDDIVQDVFLAAHSGLASLREPAAIKGWLATVAVRMATRKLRWRRLRAQLWLDSASAAELPAKGASAETHALLAQAYLVLDTLPVEERVAWVLRYLEDERLDAVAKLTGCSLATAKRRIAAAQEKMERAFEDEPGSSRVF